jgi:hypothetical protein
MTEIDHTEILAMNIWMKVFGVTSITPEWEQWAKLNPDEASGLRSQAADMLGVAKAHAGQLKPHIRTSHHHSLGWLLN